MLHLGQALRRFDYPAQTVIVKLVSGGASGASAKCSPHRDNMVFFCDILMDRVIRKARQCKTPTRKKNLGFVSRREFPDAIEDTGGLFAG